MSEIEEIIKKATGYYSPDSISAYQLMRILELYRVALLEKAAEEALIVVDTEWNEYFEPITTYEIDKSSITNIKLD